jgi:cbb3-type cytochrome c oxidase subunit III
MRFSSVVVGAVLVVIPIVAQSPKDQSAKGEQVYQQLCVGCHGPDGRAQTEMGKKVQASDLTAAVVQDQNDSQLIKVIRSGKGKMPAWEDKLSDDEIRAVLAYVRQFRVKEKR